MIKIKESKYFDSNIFWFVVKPEDFNFNLEIDQISQ